MEGLQEFAEYVAAEVLSVFFWDTEFVGDLKVHQGFVEGVEDVGYF